MKNNIDNSCAKANRKSELESIIFTVIFVFFTADSLVFGTNANAFFLKAKYLFFYSTFFYLLIKFKLQNKKIKKQDFVLFVPFLFSIPISMVINTDLRLGYFQKMIVVIASFFYCHFYSTKKFAYIYTKIMSFFVTVAIIYEICYIFMPGLARRFTITNVSGMPFYTWFVASIPTMPGGVIRNFGFTREPGVFAVFIILALLFETFVNEEKSVKRIILFVVGVFLTVSTSGYIGLAFYLIALLLYIEKFEFNNKNKIRILLLFLVIFIVYITLRTDLLFGEQYGSIFGKLYTGNAGGGSFNARLASIITNTYIGFQNIVFGKGISFVEENYSFISSQLLQVDVKDNANTLFIHFAQYGIVCFSLQWYCLIKTMKGISESKAINIFCFLTYLAVAMGQTLIASPIFFVMLFLRNEDD